MALPPSLPRDKQQTPRLLRGSLFPGQKRRSRDGFLAPSSGPTREGGTGAAPPAHAWSHSGPGWGQGGPGGEGGSEPGGRGGRPASPEDGTGGGINTGGPGMPPRPAGPGGTSKARPLAVSAAGSLLGPWALGLGAAHWDRERKGVRSPSLSDGTGGHLSFGNPAFPKPPELPPQPGWERGGRGWSGLAAQEQQQRVPHRPGHRAAARAAGTGGDHMLMQTQG